MKVISNSFKVFPERLLIYHGGTGRSAFLGCLRVTTIFMFAFFTFVVAPTHFYAEDEPILVAPAGKLHFFYNFFSWLQLYMIHHAGVMSLKF
jgi:hypothetical protein